ncbi:hypothetical protein [Thermosipho globiformans]|uniref:hypothetical protein n=1 Tax=Thermosipho globiformans TaxID=380685 RepID=UPI000F8E40D4|nr:hypothetical protein [Thermosipho globiformans]
MFNGTSNDVISKENRDIMEMNRNIVGDFLPFSVSRKRSNSLINREHTSENDPYVFFSEEVIMNSIAKHPEKQEALLKKVVEKAKKLLKKELSKLGYEYMYVNFESSSQKLFVYLKLKHENPEEYEKLKKEYRQLINLEKKIRKQYPLINVEIISLSEDEYIGQNMEYINF